MRRQTKRWSPAEDQIVRQFYADKNDQFLTFALPGRTPDAICQRAAGMGIRKSKASRSEAYRRAYLRQIEKNGTHPGKSIRPIGSTHQKGRYILIKVADPDVWKPLHRHVWEQAHGPVPEGMIVAAKDGNVRNAVLENLCLRTPAEHQLRSNHNYRDLPEELVDVLHLQNEIRKAIKRKKGNEK